MITSFEEQVAQKSTEELVHIYRHAGEYQERFVELVEAELRSRQYDFTLIARERKVKQLIEDKITTEGVPGNTVFIILGYLSAFLGGPIGIIAGYVYSQSKHKDHPGGECYVYDKRTRELGIGMMVTGIVVLFYTLLNHMY